MYSSSYDGSRLILEPKFKVATPRYPVAFVHGAGSTAIYCIDALGKQGNLTSLIVGDGYTASADDNGGTATWGNAASLTALDANVTALLARSNVRTGKVALVSASMGGVISLNYALANPTKISCIVSVIPVINPDDIKTNNRSGYAASINTAYGGTYVEATQGATKNPYTYRANSAIADIPMLLIYGATDTLCLPAYTEAFAAAAPSKRTLVQLASGHDFTTYDSVNHPQILDFIKTYSI
jgi:pimeloyl-ACP methyl ester carboxylesterase